MTFLDFVAEGVSIGAPRALIEWYLETVIARRDVMGY